VEEEAFAIRFSPWLRWLFVLIFSGPRRSRVEVTARDVRVRMGPWFRIVIPRDHIVQAEPAPDMWWAIGVHTDFRRTWWVNGSPKGMVSLYLDPRPRGRALGVAIHPRRIDLGLEERDRFLRALGSGPDHAPSS
jgi:hypothetical protein